MKSWGRIVGAVVVAVLLAISIAKVQTWRTRPQVIWRVPRGEVGMDIEFVSTEDIGVLCWRLGSDSGHRNDQMRGKNVIRGIDLRGRMRYKIALGPIAGNLTLTAIAREKGLVALNELPRRGCWKAWVLDLRSRQIAKLPEGFCFPHRVHGDCRAFSPSGECALVLPAMRGKGPARLISTRSRALVRYVRDLPTACGTWIQWQRGSNTLEWYDPDSGTLGGEDRGSVTVGAAKAFSGTSRLGVFSPDGSFLAVLTVFKKKGVLGVQVYDAGSGHLMLSRKHQVQPNEHIVAARWSPDGEKLAVIPWDEESEHSPRMYLLTEGGRSMREIRLPGWCFLETGLALAWSPDSQRLAVGVYPSDKGPKHAALAIVNVPEPR